MRTREATAIREQIRREFAQDVYEGLTGDPKRIPPKHFYDARGSELFERITEQPEYYLTSRERALFAAHAEEIVASVPPGAALVELGSGTAEKTSLLLEAMQARQDTVRYCPVDISLEALEEAAARLRALLPDLEVEPFQGRYEEALEALAGSRGDPHLVLFIGSSIGNLEPREAEGFLRQLSRALGPRDRLLLGTDLVKDPEVLHAAYNDSAGVTEAFNLNLLRRINRELGAGFDLDLFRHRAFYDAEHHRVEMHLVSTVAQTVPVRELDLTVPFEAGETIHTENSYKFTPARVREMTDAGGFDIERSWQDADGWFATHVLAPQEDGARVEPMDVT